MTLTWSRRHTLIAGVALVAISNAVALGGVAWNRSGEPDSVLQLTQRELSQPYEFGFDHEATGLTLELRYRVLAADRAGPYYPAGHYGAPEWLDRAKLASLGFDVSERLDARSAERRYQRLLPREALVVLELDGPVHGKALERARERAKKEAALEAAGSAPKKPSVPEQTAAGQLKLEETANSRLFAVDAGLDAAALRARYLDRSRYAIVRGSIRAQINRNRSGDAQFSGSIDNLHNIRVSVPPEFRRAIGAVPRAMPWRVAPQGGPAFQVIVAFGKRFEPWIIAAQAATK